MTEILTFKKIWKFALAFLTVMSGQVCYANFLEEGPSQALPGNGCMVTLQSKDGIYQNLKDRQGTYLVVVVNKGSALEKVTLGVENRNENCMNPDNSDNTEHRDISFELLDSQTNQPLSTVTLDPGGTFTFKVVVKAPEDSPIHSWSCFQVTGVTENCPASEVTLGLFSFIPDPSLEGE